MSDEDRSDPFCLKVEMINAHNYFKWSNEMEIFLRGKGLWKLVCPGTSDGSTENQRKTDLALAYILTSINKSCKENLMTLRNPEELWGTLRKTFQAF